MTTNQRITALEEKVKYLESVLDSLTHKKWTEDDLNELEAQTLTNNEKRKAIIEKAKKFVEGNFKDHWNGSGDRVVGKNIILWTVEFIVNTEKRTVVSILRRYKSSEIGFKGIAKCHPDDVFNADIGKAIALGRALGLDVSEFEQAVQPDEFAAGQIILYRGTIQEIEKIQDDKVRISNGPFHWTRRVNDPHFKITNDTDAIYNEKED